VKYLILIYMTPEGRAMWEGASDERRAAGWAQHDAFREELAAAGELVSSQALADPSLGKRVLVSAGRTVTTDGPYAEAKEYLAGYYLIDCEDEERALQRAAQLPEATLGLVEVRPGLARGGLEM
jgi:hypothetical protein